MRKICFFTGTRAEYGIMSRLMKAVNDAPDCQLQIVATNMHLSPEFGLTYREIEADGLKIDKKVVMLLSSDTPNAVVKSMGLGTIGFADALEDLRPDLCVILGDRYEMLAAAQSALIYQIPIAHIGGGGITEGAYDDSIRHCITKISHLHFPSTEKCRKRILQMGEQPQNVFCVGSLGVDNILHNPVMSRQELEESIGFDLGEKYLLVTFHPVTTEKNTAKEQCANLLKALESVCSDYKLLFTLPNSDTDGRVIISLINDFVEKDRKKRFAIQSLGKKRYYSALKFASAVVGNSSSGIVEAPSFHIPTLNIGDRQKGRERSKSIIDVAATLEEMKKGLEIVLTPESMEVAKLSKNVFEGANTMDNIFKVISTYPLENLKQKHFYDI